MKLFVIAAVSVLSATAAAYAGDKGGSFKDPFGPLSYAAGLTAGYTDYFSSGRAAGRVPPAPDSVSVTTDSYGRTSTTSTWNKK